MARRTYAQWNGLLYRIRIGGGTAAQQHEFYTALYHALLEPSIFSDANGDYLGFDNKVHRTRPRPGAVRQLLRLGHLPLARSRCSP